MRGRRVGAIIAVAATVAFLTGCTPPKVDDVATQAWIDATNDDQSRRSALLGSSWGMRSAAGA
mgnify:CR=1 FL=1